VLKIEESKDEIIIRETPALEWIGGFVTAVILFWIVYSAVSASIDYHGFALGLAILISVAFLTFSLLMNPAVITKINKPGQTVSIRKQSPLKYSFDIYSFSEIAGEVYINTNQPGNNQVTLFQIIMPMENGRKIELLSSSKYKDNQYIEAADLINRYIFDTSKQIPFKLAVFTDD
jgi:hypothetical protein